MSVDQSGAEEVSRASLFYTPELSDEQADEETKSTDKEESEASEPDTEEVDGSHEAEDETFTVKVDGEEIEVTVDQMKDSYAGVAAIQKGLRENSEQRKAIAAERETLTSDAELLINDDLDFLESDKMLELKSYDRDLYDLIVDKTKSRADRLKDLKSKVSKDQKEQSQVDIEEKKRELLELVPEWSNQAKAQEEGKLAEKRIKDVGYSDEEIMNITDPRFVALARDAALYRKIMSAKPKAKEVKIAPKSAKPGSGGKADNRSFGERFYS